MNKFMKITLAMVLALAMCFSMVACGTTEADLDELNAVLDEVNAELDAELAETEEVEEEVVEEEVAEEVATILNWEVVSVVSAEGVEMDAESVFGASMVYAFNTEVGETAVYVDGEVAAVGTFAEMEDETLEIIIDEEAAYGYMDGEYFVVETADGSLQYCSLMEMTSEEAVSEDVIVNWEVVAAVDAEGNEVSAEDMGVSIVYAFNETLKEVAAYTDGEVAAVGTYVENEDHVEIELDGEVAYGFMDGEYFVVETADGTAQYCALVG